jgi:serine/threonine protein kinase
VSTFTSEPGTRLGDRYRLEDRVAAAAGWAAWKAIDETLARPVTVITFAPGFPRLHEVVGAARSASRLTDSRFAQVFDVEEDWDHAYIVMEWASGESLDDMLAPGPLDAVRGARIIAEAADAMAAAHAAGLAHLCLNPDCLRWTPGGGVKITGLGIDAALAEITAEDPAQADTHRLGMLLYAALTGHWPGPDWPALPPAPLADGLPCSPRQVRAGVPAALDEITNEALQQRGRNGAAALTTPAELAVALQEAIPPVPIPQLPQPPPRPRGSAHRPGSRSTRETEYWAPADPEPTYWSPDGRPAPSPRESPRRRSGMSGVRVSIIAVLVAAVVAGLVVVAFHSLHNGHPAPSAVTRPPSSTRTSTAVVTLAPVSAQAFEDNPTGTNLAVDNNPQTAWQTHWYLGNPVFGGLQQGSGLILDMGHSVRLSSVTITFGSIPGADVQIKIGNPAQPVPPQNDPSAAQATADSMTTVAQQNDVGDTVTFPVTSSASGRYVLIWFTKLPPMANQPNKYQADVYNVVVKGIG